ncbi:MAG: hypothetical protein QM598_09790 [Protaetiibacter sp.]
MRSRWALGAIAITAIIVAAISFAVVDISTSAASGCLDTRAPCTERTTPEIATVFAAIGAAALLVAAVAALTWIVRNLATKREVRQTDVDYSRGPSARVRDDEDDDVPTP